MAKKERKKKSGGMGIATLILVPILIILLLASSFYAILDAIIQVISKIIGNFIRGLVELIKNPAQWISNKWADLTNWFRREITGGDNFNEKRYDNLGRQEPVMIIEQNVYDSMIENLDKIIDRNPALLDDDIMLKKMLLTYYRGIYLDGTTVLIELTAEDLELQEIEIRY